MFIRPAGALSEGRACSRPGFREGRCPGRGRRASRWFFPFTCLKIKNSSPNVSCTSGSICLYNRVSSRSVEINKQRETTTKNCRRTDRLAGGGKPRTATTEKQHLSFQAGTATLCSETAPLHCSSSPFPSPATSTTLTLPGGTGASLTCACLHS